MVNFKINIYWNQKDHSFPAKLLQLGNMYKIEAVINGTTVLFDRNEASEWKAITYHSQESPDTALITKIIEELKTM
jgi:hypothetical protein